VPGVGSEGDGCDGVAVARRTTRPRDARLGVALAVLLEVAGGGVVACAGDEPADRSEASEEPAEWLRLGRSTGRPARSSGHGR
jgi:hypothetical protein